MRVTRAQADENRSRVIDVASRLFRERGFDGIGLKDLMASAGLTPGGFYKQFQSKDDLAAQASERAMNLVSERWSQIAAAQPGDPFTALVEFYLSPEHRNERADGCPLAALGSDAARQGPEVKAAFEAGMRAHLEVLQGCVASKNAADARQKAMVILSTMVGALVLSRASGSPVFSTEILTAAVKELRLHGSESAIDAKASTGLAAKIAKTARTAKTAKTAKTVKSATPKIAPAKRR